MSLIRKIKTEVEAMGLQFFYDSGGGLNEMIEKADFSEDNVVVFAFLLSVTNFEDGKESGQIGLFFAKVTELDFEAMENDDIQEECKEVAFEFLKRIDSGNVLTYGSSTLRRFYDEFDINVTGVAINADFAERVGLSVCLP